LTLIFGFSSKAQSNSSGGFEPYDYDTTLIGGYKISFKADDSLQYLYLKKGDTTISELASTSTGMPYKNLGYVGADFKDYFVLVHSFGSGNPNYIELIKKATGQNNLRSGAAWIDVSERQGLLLYCNKDVPSPKDKMILYNVNSNRSEPYNFPSDIFNEPEILNRISIKKLTDKQLVIKYETEKGSKTKLYSR
jgi:hypothetical protein